MKSILLISIILSISGCASLHKEVFNTIHEGDSSDHVVEVLGQPDSYGPSQGEANADAWYFTRRGEICGFTIKDKKVLQLGCASDPSYRSPAQKTLGVFGSMLQGAGNGLSNASSTPSKQPTNCTTIYGNGLADTHCN